MPLDRLRACSERMRCCVVLCSLRFTPLRLFSDALRPRARRPTPSPMPMSMLFDRFCSCFGLLRVCLQRSPARECCQSLRVHPCVKMVANKTVNREMRPRAHALLQLLPRALHAYSCLSSSRMISRIFCAMLSTSNGAWPRSRLATGGFVSVTLQADTWHRHGHAGRRESKEKMSVIWHWPTAGAGAAAAALVVSLTKSV